MHTTNHDRYLNGASNQRRHSSFSSSSPQAQSSTKVSPDLLGPKGEQVDVPPCLLSPAFTPPSTPGTRTPGRSTEPATGSASEQDTIVQPTLLEELPEVKCQVRARIPRNGGGEIFLHLYSNNIDNKEHLAIVFGDVIRSRSLDAPQENETEMVRMTRGAYTGRLYPGRTSSSAPSPSQGSDATVTQTPETQIPLVRIHSECYTGETAWSARCDCGEQLDEAARLMTLEGNGVVVYLRQEGRGIGLAEKLKAYNLQDLGNDTVTANLLLRHPADARSYGLATAILQDLGLSTIRLLTNNPIKVAAVEGPNKEIKVAERVPMVPLAWRGLKGGVSGEEVDSYLKTKIHRMGHLLPDLGL
ncbi:uncharacterized protein DFL_009542 [Arthrobotrys flagrans]|uniref:GTP cyclohydrolase II n=1 Tax=Arthrobotrys flagrans TaxID=97331 RepID=A0A436ZRY0_ARTFL|nr:hypothetical protein DFL_009542 [Arthrobotrys flagrans]